MVDELKEWLERANDTGIELKKLTEVQSLACRQETEAKCWQFLETRLSLLLAQYKTSEEVSERYKSFLPFNLTQTLRNSLVTYLSTNPRTFERFHFVYLNRAKIN